MKCILTLSIIIVSQFVIGQTFTEIPQFTPIEGTELSSVAFADIDNDSDIDLLITGLSTANTYIVKLYSNDGSGIYSEVTDTPFDVIFGGSAAFVDIDGDNDKDIIITGSIILDYVAYLYINDGEGNFLKVDDMPFEGTFNGSLMAADIDNDSDMDVIFTGVNNDGEFIAKLYKNNGEGEFTESQDTPFEGVRSSSIAIADVNGDNYKDVLITGRNQFLNSISRLYINDGTGGFSEPDSFMFEDIESGSVVFADIDGDGDNDLLLSGLNIADFPVSRLYKNDGTGSFDEVLNTPFEGVQFGSIGFSDIDGDNDLDVLLSGRRGPGIRITKLYSNDGNGNYTEIVDTPFEGVQSGSIDFVDVDGDTDEDVFITGLSSSSNRIAELFANNLISSTKSIKEEYKLDLITYPNPANENNINVLYDSQSTGYATVNIYGVNGILIAKQKQYVLSGEQIINVDINQLTKGSYFIEVEDNKAKGVVQFMVQ